MGILGPTRKKDKAVSNPSTDTTHSLSLEAVQATLISDEDREAQEVEEQRLKPPKTSKCEFALGGGRMAVTADGAAIQVPAAVRPGLVTLSRLYQMIFEGRRVCAKYDAPCIYTAVPRRRGSSKKTNVAYVQMVALDLDGTINGQGMMDKLRRWCRLFACILYSTARHDPANNTYRLRILIPVNASLSYEEARLVARSVCGQLAAYLGTSDGIDPCCERPFQPMLLPGWADQRLADQAICELYDEGDIMDVSVQLADARKQIEEIEEEKRARACAVVATRRPRSSVPGAAVVEVDGIDRLERARADLDALGSIRAGSGRSNRDLFVAACVLRDWQCDLSDAISEMQSRYSDQDPTWLEAKTRSAYDAGAGSPRTGWRYRAAVAESSLTLEGMFDLDTNGGVHATPPEFVAATPIVPHGPLKKEEKPHVDQAHVDHLEVGRRSWRREVHARHLDKLRSFGDLRARVTGIRSATGTGKNAHLKPAIQRLLTEGGRIVTIAHRRSLTRSQSAVWGLPCYLDSNDSQIGGSTSVCLDSVGRIAEGPVDVVVLDEVEQVLRHLYSATIRHRGQVGVVFSALRDLLRRAKRIIVMDADLGPLAMWSLRVLLGEDVSTEVVVNTWQPSGKIRVRTPAGMQADIMADAQAGRALWIYSTSKRAAKRYAHMIGSLGVGVLLVHSGTTGTPEVQECMADPSLFQRYQVVIATPSVGTGVSVDDLDHWRVYGDCTSGAGPIAPDAKQGLMRVRHPQQVTICVHGRTQYEPTNPEMILADLLLTSERTRKLLEGQTWTAKYQLDKDAPVELHPADLDITRIQAEVMAVEAKLGNQLHDVEIRDEDGNITEIQRGALLTHLEEVGYQLDIVPDEITLDTKALEEERKAAKLAVEAAWVEAVVSAPDATEGEIQALEDAGASTPEAEATLAKAKIEEFYGTEVDPDLVDRDDHGRRRGQCRTAAHILAWQRGEQQAVLRLDRLDGRAGVSVQLRHQGKKAALAAGLWSLFGITDLEADARNGTVLKDPGDVGSLEQLRAEVKRYLRITLKPGSSAFLLARALAAQSGFKLSSRRTRSPEGKLGREYMLERDSVSDMMRDASAYYERLTDPTAHMAQVFELGLTPEQMQDQVEAILAA